MNLPHPWSAASALALIGTDPGVRRVYLASYRGDGDALVALTEVVATEARVDAAVASDANTESNSDAASDIAGAEAAELRHLRDLAYGRPTALTAGTERDLATERLAAISAAEHRRSADVYAALNRMKDVLTEGGPPEPTRSEPIDVETPDASEMSGAEASNQASSAPSPPASRVSFPPRVLLIATLAAGIVIGIGVGLASAIGFENPVSTSAPTDAAILSAPSDLLTLTRFPGNVTAADTWFARAQTEVDVFNGFIIFEDERVDLESSRFAGTTASDWRIWVARTPSKGFCLIGRHAAETVHASSTQKACVSRAKFEQSSVRLELDSTTVVWNGKTLLTSIRW
ncbi:hypothetical protein AB4Y63_09180 [Leifsonia sp. YAF41]|uniref:hypothetical protein n=1 Tax=Leifsonia sp. YAF41 TaxID=3233086 RepID=UPI003F9A4859